MTMQSGAPLHIYTTGTVSVGSTFTSGTLNATGEVYVDGGVLRVYSGSQFNLSADQTLFIQNGGTADFRSFNINGSKVVFDSGRLSYAGDLLVGEGGALGGSVTLDSTRHLTLTGTTSVDPFFNLSITGGSLNTGSLVNRSDLVLTSGTLNTTTATLTAGGELDITLSGTTRDTQYCALSASGTVSLAGSLFVYLDNFTPAIGDTFDILDGTLSGVFASPLQLPALPAGRAWDTSNLYTTGVIKVVATGIPGDYNGNGIVDAADYTVWRDHFGQTFGLPNRDSNSHGPIGAPDYDFWKSHFGNHAGSGAGGAAGVPEPSSLALAGLGALTALAIVVMNEPKSFPMATSQEFS
jgi:hypothetical protein